MRNIFLTITILAITLTLKAQNNCPEFISSPNIYAGLEIGSRGMKPAIVRFEVAENGKTSFITLSRDLTPINTNPAKAKTKAEMDCTVDRIVRYVNVFRNDPYNVADDRIVLVMSSGLKMKLADRDSLITYLKDRVKRQTGLSILEMTEKEEGEDKIKNLLVDEDYPFNHVNAFDIGSGNITGGSTDKTGQNISSFATDGSINSITNYVNAEITKQNLDIKIPHDRAIIAKMAADRFKEKHMSQMTFAAGAQEVVVGGGSNFVMMSWFKAESFNDKRLNPFFLPYIYDYYLTLVSSTDKEEFFKNNRAKDNSPLTWKGKQRLSDAKAIFNDVELLVGAGIMKTIYDDLSKKGVKNFYFDDQMLNSGLRYFLYKKYKGLLTASSN